MVKSAIAEFRARKKAAEGTAIDCGQGVLVGMGMDVCMSMDIEVAT